MARCLQSLTAGKLHSHIADIVEQAQELFSRLVKEYAEKEGVTEQLKATDQMARVRKMNNIRSRATEVVNSEWCLYEKTKILSVPNRTTPHHPMLA